MGIGRILPDYLRSLCSEAETMICLLCDKEPEFPYGYTKNGKFVCYSCAKAIKFDPIEEARAFQKYVVSHGWGAVSELAKITHRSPSHISQRLSLLEQTELVKLLEGRRPSVSDVSTP